MTQLNAISLFSGMGGDTLGMINAGVKVEAFCEFSHAAIQSHMLNFPESKLIEDLCHKKTQDQTNITLIQDALFEKYKNTIDIIFAGHPCQGFSNGGKKLPDDPRNTLFREFARVVRLISPKYIIGENVDGLLTRKTTDGQLFMTIIIKEFETLGYTISYKVINVLDYGIPQLRKRLVYVGLRNDLNKIYNFPKPLNTKTNLPNLANIVKFNMTGAIKILPNDFDMTSIPQENILTDLNNDEDEVPETIHPYLYLKAKTHNAEYKGKVFKNLLSYGKRDSPIHAEIINIFKPCKTIICSYDHQPRLFVPLKNERGYFIRCLVPEELKQIQGFPSTFQIYGNKKEQVKQIGNAVPPPLITQIVKELLIFQ
uniref:DNA (cytosine-5-)-methyltransferase n=1 Tax=viral metagenome TaxID=1070528 RepID=A0A6C0H414_9ZZZZ